MSTPVAAAPVEQWTKTGWRSGWTAIACSLRVADPLLDRRRCSTILDKRLRLESDAAREEQEKRAMELRCRRDRSVQEQELEAAATKHKLEVQAMSTAQNRKVAAPMKATPPMTMNPAPQPVTLS